MGEIAHARYCRETGEPQPRRYEAGTLDRLGDAQCAMGELETACATWHRSLAIAATRSAGSAGESTRIRTAGRCRTASIQGSAVGPVKP
jgi:hypothetical protein